MPPKIQIIFSKSDKIYNPGDIVKGCVRIFTGTKVKCKGFITFEGFGLVHLKGISSNKFDSDKRYSKKEIYYSNRFKIIGRGSSKQTLTPGEHSFEFSHILPYKIPSSFETEYGIIQHSCVALLEFKEEQTKKLVENLQIISKYDFSSSGNSNSLQGPFAKYFVKEIGLFKKYLTSVNLKINRTAFNPFDEVVINADIKNNSDCPISMAKAEIVKVITYKTNIENFTEYIPLCSNVKIYSKDNPENNDWSNEKLQVPQILPSLSGSSIINVQYNLRFQIFTKSDNLAVMEGNIPLSIRYISADSDYESAVCEDDSSYSNLACSLHAPTDPLTAVPILDASANQIQSDLPSTHSESSASLYRDITVPILYASANQIQSDLPFTHSESSASLYRDISPPSYEEVISQSRSSNK